MEIAKKWVQRFGPTKSKEAFLAGVKAALEYAISRCYSGSTPAMIAADLTKKIEEAKDE